MAGNSLDSIRAVRGRLEPSRDTMLPRLVAGSADGSKRMAEGVFGTEVSVVLEY